MPVKNQFKLLFYIEVTVCFVCRFEYEIKFINQKVDIYCFCFYEIETDLYNILDDIEIYFVNDHGKFHFIKKTGYIQILYFLLY